MSDQKRPYRMRRRAELEELTRRRITESAVELHEELGPARTSIAAIAERAGVRRSTVYRHFPTEDALFDACSSHWRAANPPPDPSAWAAIDHPAERTSSALRDLYAFYGRTQDMYSSLLRDEPARPACAPPATRLLSLPGHDRGCPHGRPRSARERGKAHTRSYRARTRLHDLALAHRRAGTRRYGCRRPHVPARRKRRADS